MASLKSMHQVFEQVIDLPHPQQLQRIRELCGGDRELEAAVERLVARDARAQTLDEMFSNGIADQAAALIAGAPEHLGPYRVVAELGRGGMGVVYLAEQHQPQRQVALKCIRPDRIGPQTIASFNHEVQIMVSVVHPGIPQVYQLLEIDGVPVVAMELVDGVPLAEAVAQLPRADRIALLIGLAGALAAAHEAAVVHGDVKPDNVLVTAEGPKLLDFGIASLRRHEVARGATLAYAAPEQLCGLQLLPASDVYALGVTAWEVLTGTPLFDGTSTIDEAIAARDAGLPRRSGLPRDLDAVLRRSLEPDPQRRYPSARQLRDDLVRYRDGQLVTALEGPLVRARTWLGHRRRALLQLMLGALILGIGLWVGWRVWEARREARAHTQLVALQQQLADLSPRDPEWIARFEALVRRRGFRHTPADGAAWLWRAERLAQAPVGSHPDAIALDHQERRRILVQAWLGSVRHSHALRQRVLSALAGLLEEQGDWAALERVVRHLDAPAPRLEMASAIARRDWSALRAAAPGALGFVADLLEGATPTGPRPRLAAIGGPDRLIRIDTAPLVLQTTSGTELRRWPVEGEPLALAVSPGSVGLLHDTPGGSRWSRADLDRQGWRRSLEAGPRWEEPRALLVDLDQDGTLEEILAGSDRAWIFDSGLGRFRPLDPELSASGLSVRDLEAMDLDLDGGAELIIGGGGPQAADLRVIGSPRGAPTLLDRIRVQARAVAAGRDRRGTYVLVAGSTAIPHGAPPTGSRPLVASSRWSDGGLEDPVVVRSSTPLAALELLDLDGDGTLEVVARDPGGGLLLGQLAPDGGVALVRVPGLTLLATGDADGDGDAEIWVADPSRSWLLGTGTAPVDPQPIPAETEGILPSPERGAQPLEWLALTHLSTLGLRSEAALALARLAPEGPGGDPARLASLTHADRATAVEIAQLVGQAPEQPAAVRRAMAGALGRGHALDELTRLDPSGLEAPWQGVIASLSEATHLDLTTAPHPAWHLDRPEAMAWNPIEGSLSLFLEAGGPPIARLPLRWDGTALMITLSLDADPGGRAGLEVALEGPGWSHRLIASPHAPPDAPCALSLSTTGGARVPIRLTLLGGSDPSMGCDPGGQRRIYAVPTLEPGPIWLVLRPTAGDPAAIAHTRASLHQLTIQGASIADTVGPQGAAAFVVGEIEALTAAAAGQDLLATIARVRSGQPPDPARLRQLSVRDQAFLLRFYPDTHGAGLREALGEGFFPLWRQTYLPPDPSPSPAALDAVLRPEVAGLDPGEEGQRAIALVRAEALLIQGRVAEARALLARLRLAAEEGPTWGLTTRLRIHLGDEAGAQEAIAGWLARAPGTTRVVDQIVDDPVLARLAPGELEVRSVPAPPDRRDSP